MTANLITGHAHELRTGGWRGIVHGDGRTESFWVYRSVRDPRVSCTRIIPRRGGEIRNTYSFSPAAEVEGPFAALIAAGEGQIFASLTELAEAVLRHDGLLSGAATEVAS